MPENNLERTAINQSAIISLAAGSLTWIAFCVGVAPVPFTGFVCFPGAALLSVVALIWGLKSLREIKSSDQRGRGLAIAGSVMGGSAILAEICLSIITVVFWSRLEQLLQSVHP
ncbi:MAG TPA: DUF4190 domain-containing protein [Anaerolineales bacterium]